MEDFVSFMPTKRLFIDILTKDISVRDCIFDLLDNSVDSYVRNDIKDRRRIEINISSKKFSVLDNCGGISVDFLQKEVFRSGLRTSIRNKPTIGVYGIGLKRSIFKLGRTIHFETDDKKNNSYLEIDVVEWEKQEDEWDLPFTHSSTLLRSTQKPYTEIIIEDLTDEAKESFTNVFEVNPIV